jgi:hypothetical protein
MFFGSDLFGERPWQHEFGFEYGTDRFDHPIQRCGHPILDRMKHPLLHLADPSTRIGLVPASIEVFGSRSQLDHEVA